MPTSRRALLRAAGTSAAAALAGCAGLRGCVHTATFELVPATPEQVTGRLAEPAGRLGPSSRGLARSAIEGEPVSYRACEHLFDDGIYVLDDTYYRLTATAESTVETTGYRVDYEFIGPEATEPPADRVVPFDELSGADRRALRYGFLDHLDQKAGSDDDLVHVSGTATVCHPDVDESALLPSSEHEFIEYRGVVLAFTVVEPVDETLTTFRLRAREVAGSPAAFVEYAFAELLAEPVDLDERSLSDRQEAVLRSAVPGQVSEGGFRTCVDEGRPSAEFEELMRLIFDDDFRLDRGFARHRPVVWGGERYLASYQVAVA